MAAAGGRGAMIAMGTMGEKVGEKAGENSGKIIEKSLKYIYGRCLETKGKRMKTIFSNWFNMFEHVGMKA